MTSSFNQLMQKEKIALIALVIVVVAALCTFLIAVNTDIFENLFEGQKAIENGDYADVHFIGHYASNDTIFVSSYEYPENRTGGSPAKIFVTLNSSDAPITNFSGYSNTIENDFISGFIENLVGMKKGETKTTVEISPEKAYGVLPKEGDIIDLVKLIESNGVDTEGKNFSYTILSVIPNATMPTTYQDYFGNVNTTTNFTLRDNKNYVGEIIDLYPSWKNSSVVTKLDVKEIWITTTLPANLTENFTWVDSNATTGLDTTFPENCSTITSISNTSIVIRHNPSVNSNITLTYLLYGSSITYTVESITNDTINASNRASATANKTYIEFKRQTTITLNSSQNITVTVPGEVLDSQLLTYVRDFDSDFHLSYTQLSDKSVYFDIYVIKVYNVS